MLAIGKGTRYKCYWRRVKESLTCNDLARFGLFVTDVYLSGSQNGQEKFNKVFLNC